MRLFTLKLRCTLKQRAGFGVICAVIGGLGPLPWTAAATPNTHINTPGAAHARYVQTVQQCRQRFASAECERSTRQRYDQESYVLRQAQQMRKTATPSTMPRRPLSKKQTPVSLVKGNDVVRPALQGAMPSASVVTGVAAVAAPKARLAKQVAAQNQHRAVNTALMAPKPVKIPINLNERQAQTAQKKAKRAARNAKRQQQGFVVDAVNP
jgi:hypothetical protein